MLILIFWFCSSSGLGLFSIIFIYSVLLNEVWNYVGTTYCQVVTELSYRFSDLIPLCVWDFTTSGISLYCLMSGCLFTRNEMSFAIIDVTRVSSCPCTDIRSKNVSILCFNTWFDKREDLGRIAFRRPSEIDSILLYRDLLVLALTLLLIESCEISLTT